LFAFLLDQLHHRLNHKLRRPQAIAPGLIGLAAQQGDDAGAFLGGGVV
jgi:hypothetical protein